MGRNRFVKPKTVRLELSDGDWIEIKDELNVGEFRDAAGAGLSRAVASETKEGDLEYITEFGEFAIKRAAIYLVDWSFVDADGDEVELTFDAVRQLDNETFEEIEEAIDKHVEAKQAAKKSKAEGEEKNAEADATK